MKKLIKILLICGVTLVVLLGAGLITLKVMFPPEKLKAMAESYTKDNFHREISFDDVSFNLIGITLDNFALSEEDSFEKGTFVKADKLQVKVALKPLFQKKIEVSSLIVNGLEINVVKQADGSFNFDSLTAAASSAPETQTPEQVSSPAMDFDLTIAKISITDCAFSYKDMQSGMNASVDKLNLEIWDFDLANSFSFKVKFTLGYDDAANGMNMSIPVTVDTVVSLANLDMQKAYITVKGITAAYKNVQFAMNGEVKNFMAPSVNLTGSLTGIDHTIFADFLPDLPAFNLPKVTVSVQAAADIEKSTAVINQIKVGVLNSGLTASGNASWAGANPTYNINGSLAFALAEAVQMTDTVADFKPAGNITGTFSATDKLDGKDVRGNITLKDVSVMYEPVKISALNGLITIASADDVSASNLTGLLNGEKFTASFSYKNIKEIMNIVFNLDLSKLKLEKFSTQQMQAAENATTTAPAEQQPAAQQPAATSTDEDEMLMNIQATVKVGAVEVPYFSTQGFEMTANLTSASPSMTKANGVVTFKLMPGSITDLDTVVKENKIVKILLLPINIINRVAKALNIDLFPAEKSAQDGLIIYDIAEGQYNFVNGVMTVEKTVLTSKLTNINGSGKVDFPKDNIDMKVSATVLTSQTPVVIKITGPVDNPSGKLDVLNTVGSLVGGILNKDTPGKLISGTANTAGAVATGAVKTTGKVAETAVKTGTDVVKGTVGVATGTVKGTVNTAKDALKNIGSLFKKKDTDEDK